jgi:hypothetical protein
VQVGSVDEERSLRPQTAGSILLQARADFALASLLPTFRGSGRPSGTRTRACSGSAAGTAAPPCRCPAASGREARRLYTIGHGTRTLDEFVGLLKSVEVTLLGDVRTVPRSRTNPHYNREALPDSLRPHGIGYEHMAALGGLRGRVPEVAPNVNGFWINKSFHNYADYAMSERFRAGLAHLRQIGETQRCAIMCAETVWWRCHRRIITDYLLAAGEQVFHIVSLGKVERAVINEAARPHRTDVLVYPVEPSAQSDLFDRP